MLCCASLGYKEFCLFFCFFLGLRNQFIYMYQALHCSTECTVERKMNLDAAIQEEMQKLGLSYLKDKQKEAAETFLRRNEMI